MEPANKLVSKTIQPSERETKSPVSEEYEILFPETEEQVNLPLDESNETIEPRTGEKCIRNLIHASKCDDTCCDNPNCNRMKQILKHIETCKLKCYINKEGCLVCKQLVIVLEFYAMHYNQNEEFVLPASSITDIISIKIEELQLPKQLLEARILIRENIRCMWTLATNSNENSEIKKLLIVRTVVNYREPERTPDLENSDIALTLVHRPLPIRLRNHTKYSAIRRFHTEGPVGFSIPFGINYRRPEQAPEPQRLDAMLRTLGRRPLPPVLQNNVHAMFRR